MIDGESSVARLCADVALTQVIAPDSLPVRYGGTCCCAGAGGCWRNSPEERALWTLVDRTTPPAQRAELPCGAAAA